jgi:multidrug efflux pump subunit AcrA (membrane-fusion protein)
LYCDALFIKILRNHSVENAKAVKNRVLIWMMIGLVAFLLGAPLLDVELIELRLDAVAALTEKDALRRDLREKLQGVRDLERLSSRIALGVANARLQLDRCTVRSPIDGRTGSLLIYRGNLVRSTDTAPAVIINQIAPIRAAFSVPEQNLPRIQEYRAKGTLKNLTTGVKMTFTPYPAFLLEMIADGGIYPHIKKEIKAGKL